MCRLSNSKISIIVFINLGILVNLRILVKRVLLGKFTVGISLLLWIVSRFFLSFVSILPLHLFIGKSPFLFISIPIGLIFFGGYIVANPIFNFPLIQLLLLLLSIGFHFTWMILIKLNLNVCLSYNMDS